MLFAPIRAILKYRKLSPFVVFFEVCMKTVLLSRALFCPIGVKSNVRMLPSTFIRLCKFHQEQALVGGVQGKASVSIVHQSACENCNVAELIMEGADPVKVVEDVEWITTNELTLIQNRLTSVVSTVTALCSTDAVHEDSTKGYTMKNELLEIQELLQRIDTLLSNILSKVPEDTVVLEHAPAKPTDSKSIVHFSPQRLELAKKLYTLDSEGKSRAEISAEFNLNRKYISQLIRTYAASLS